MLDGRGLAGEGSPSCEEHGRQRVKAWSTSWPSLGAVGSVAGRGMIVAMAAIGAALLGAFIELCQLLLVVVGAVFGARISMSHGAALSGYVQQLGFFVAYSAFVLPAARDVIQGWLGMVAARQPERFGDRYENGGRAFVAVAFSVLVLALFAVVPGSGTRTQRAFELAFVLFALFVFGLGSAVPRAWFAVHATAARSADPMPQLLRQAGKRGALLCYCTILGIGIALAAAQCTVVQRHASASSVAAEPSALVETDTREAIASGELCRTPTVACPAELRITRTFLAATHVEVWVTSIAAELPSCTATLGPGVEVTAQRDAIERALDDSAAIAPPIAVSAGARIALRIAVPDGVERCSYTAAVHEVYVDTP